MWYKLFLYFFVISSLSTSTLNTITGNILGDGSISFSKTNNSVGKIF
jgi:hypothetical protein